VPKRHKGTVRELHSVHTRWRPTEAFQYIAFPLQAKQYLKGKSPRSVFGERTVLHSVVVCGRPALPPVVPTSLLAGLECDKDPFPPVRGCEPADSE